MKGSIVRCDACGEWSRRREGYPCPDHWFYLESVDRTFDPELGVYVVWACSQACRDLLWKRGPGPRSIDDDGTAERRAQLSPPPADGGRR